MDINALLNFIEDGTQENKDLDCFKFFKDIEILNSEKSQAHYFVSNFKLEKVKRELSKNQQSSNVKIDDQFFSAPSNEGLRKSIEASTNDTANQE